MAEEDRFQSPEGNSLCANNCGFFGSPATLNLCSKCYRDFRLKEQQQSSSTATAAAVDKTLPASSSSSSFTTSISSSFGDVACDGRDSATATPAEPKAPTVGQPNRCSVCRRRVGLTGFRCKCGTTFCGTHRYPEQHGCTFDFKGVEREAIAKANPVIKAKKLEKV